MRILSRSKPKLLAFGFDCDVYLVSDRLVYKHYAPYKLGSVLYGRKPPTEFLESIQSPSVERVIDSDDEGFITDRAKRSCGNFLFYSSSICVKKQIQSYEEICKILRKQKHNDISPNNLLVIGDRIVLVDWCNREEEPYYSFLEDGVSLYNWFECIKGRSRWFSPVNYKQIQIFSLKMGLGYISSRFCFDSKTVASFVFRMVESQKVLWKCSYNGTIPFDVYLDLFEFYISKYGEVLKENLRRIQEWVK